MHIQLPFNALTNQQSGFFRNIVIGGDYLMSILKALPARIFSY